MRAYIYIWKYTKKKSYDLVTMSDTCNVIVLHNDNIKLIIVLNYVMYINPVMPHLDELILFL